MTAAEPLLVRAGEEARLRAIAVEAPVSRALRARAVLLAAEGRSNTEIARVLSVSRQSVVTWRRRYVESGLAGLVDKKRSGRPPRVDAWTAVEAALEPRADADALWTSRLLGRRLGLSPATVTRSWRAHGLAPRPGGAVRLACEPSLEVDRVEVVGIFATGSFGVTAFRPHASSNASGMTRAVTRGGNDAARRSRAGVVGRVRELMAAADARDGDLELLREFVRAHEDCELLVTPGVGSLRARRAPSVQLWRSLTAILVALHCRSQGADLRLAAPPAILDTTHRRPTSSDSVDGLTRVTMREVAAEARVSVKTVSNVLSGAKPVAGPTRARVEAAVGLLGYQVNTAARHLRTGRRGAVVLAVPEFRVSYFAELTELLIDVAAEQGVAILVEVTRGQRDRELAVIGAARGRADGVIMAAHGLSQADLSSIAGAHPFVLVGENVNGSAVDRIAISNVEASRDAMAHLLRSGRRRVALLGVASSPVAEARVRGCAAAARELGVHIDPGLVLEASPWHRAAGERAIATLLARGDPFDAVVGFNDELALGASRALQAQGIRVPEDVALVGFDNSADAAFATPSITSIAPDLEDIARRALGIVVERQRQLASGAPIEPQQLLAPHTLVVRESAP
jgi:DNA-binding LacI/PurR family transcriptional regulator/transposase